jgi:pyridoxamine 5'-phosphate oxidase
MKEYLRKLRKDYSMLALDEADLEANALVQFEKWMVDAANAEVNEPNAMVLSTVSNQQPHSRIVLLRDVSQHGFSFYTNYNSDKGQEIELNKQVALNFFWVELERQVRIEGVAEKISLLESADYYKSRPRENQISAWASPQSQVIESRKVLEDFWKAEEEKWKNEVEITRPPFWGGYVVKPSIIEFWQGRPGRLHDRIRYTKQNSHWLIERLAP